MNERANPPDADTGPDTWSRDWLIHCLAVHVLRECDRDPERIRAWLDRWEAKHGTADGLRERCRRLWAG